MSDAGSDDEGEKGPSIGTYEGDRDPESGARQGQGKTVLPNGDTYTGGYQNGKRHGQGKYRFKKSQAIYEGEYSQGKKHGRGVFHYPDGSKYDGQWVDDLRSGHGVYTHANGDTYDGEWANNVREGRGVYTYSLTGSKFEGLWTRDRRAGHGTIHHTNHKFSGTFVDDQVIEPPIRCILSSCSLAPRQRNVLIPEWVPAGRRVCRR